MRRSAWAGSFLDGANVASLGLMATVTWQLGRAALVDGITVGMAFLATLLVFRLRVNSAWLVLGGAVLGLGRTSCGEPPRPETVRRGGVGNARLVLVLASLDGT
jgi:chromate transport protein ChrA